MEAILNKNNNPCFRRPIFLLRKTYKAGKQGLLFL